MLHRCLLCLVLVAVVSASWLAPSAAEAQSPTKMRVYIGTYTGPQSKGIYLSTLDLATGKLSAPEVAAELTSPSFLAIHPSGKYVYAVGEIADFQGKKAGAVSALAVDPHSGKLKLINQQPSGGAGPCHVSVDPSGKCVLAANYGGGSVCSFPIGDDGSLKDGGSVIQHKGSSVNEKRQKEPHAHSINVDKGGHYAFAADLGLDQVLVYKLNAAHGTLEADDHVPPAKVAPGSGPRHFAFHPSGKFAYVINELANTVVAFEYNPHHGSLTEIQTITTLPKDFTGTSYCAEVVVHPSGKFLYGSNRGHNSIAVFAIDEKTGKLTATSHQGEGIKTPRGFAVEPTGKFLLVGNQDTGSVIVFAIDQKTGALTPTGSKIEVGAPVCIRFWPVK
jgi:6-phosphogluconolactonase